MPVPLAIAAPAIIGAGAYLNAKHNISSDYRMLKAYFGSAIRLRVRERKDRISLFYILEERAHDKKYASKPYLLFEGQSWTYRQVYDIAISYGTYMKDTFNIRPKEVVAVDMGNHEQFIWVWFGLWAIGARPAFLNYNLEGKPLQHCIKVSTTRLVIVDPQFSHIINAEGFQDELPGIQFAHFTPDVHAQALSTKGVRSPDKDRSEDKVQNMALLIYTSGTTGLPKPAVVSWLKAIVSSTFCNRFMKMNENDIFYTSMPLYHSAASMLGCMNVLGMGATLSLGRKFSTKIFWEEVRASNATVMQYVGETCRYLLAAPPSPKDLDNKIRIAFGNGLRPDIWNKFKERFGVEAICEFYAATEGAGGSWNLSKNDYTKGAIGKWGTVATKLMMAGCTLVLVDWETEEPYRDAETGRCVQVARGEPGELLFKLDENDIEAKFQGYFNSPGATNSKVLRSVVTEGDAWFRTGDVIKIDDEGRSFFVDRIGDTFRWKSENVSTNEVSEVLGYHPSVHEANVYGVELPHHDGRAGCAQVILSEPVTDRLMADLAAHAKKLPGFARPIFLRISKGGPVTGTMKQQKHLLRKEGVDLEKVRNGEVAEDQMFWLRGEKYVPFTEADWQQLNAGGVKL